MIPDHIPKTYYDKWGQDGFNNWIFDVVQRIHGSDYFVPGSIRGADGGIDAEYVRADQIPFVIQIKWREVGSYDASRLRSSITATFTTEASSWGKRRKEIKYLFITNVALTKTHHDTFKKIVRNNPLLHIEYWTFERLNSLLREYEDLYERHCPYFTREEIEKYKAEKEQLRKSKKVVEKKYAKKVSASEFKDIQYKIKDLFINPELQEKFYYAFIYFLQPFYIDVRGDVDRSILRQLLDISVESESRFIDKLAKSGQILIIGSLVSVSDIDLAKSILNEMINSIQIPLEKVVDLFIKKP